MIEVLREMQRVRYMTTPEQWSALDCEVYNEDGTYLGRFIDSTLAEAVCALHNIYLPICNILVMFHHKLKDRKAMRKEQDANPT